MIDLNRVVLVGRFTRDPEMRGGGERKHVCRFTLAVNTYVPSKEEGIKKIEASYIDCIAFGRVAEIINRYGRKGQRCGVDGSLRQSNWEAKDGQRRSKLEVIVQNFMFLDPKIDDLKPRDFDDQRDDDMVIPEASELENLPQGYTPESPVEGTFDEEIPF
ncbi:MAG: single-stranded DNA-binding protein [Leptospiraceae bacterium]|nr:single-stranded DNA-binding protein [Leptospiraceae bacterium]MDW8307596.1 single-stranded DNA-binding protein [Leptospiraceae bacterium]